MKRLSHGPGHKQRPNQMDHHNATEDRRLTAHLGGSRAGDEHPQGKGGKNRPDQKGHDADGKNHHETVANHGDPVERAVPGPPVTNEEHRDRHHTGQDVVTAARHEIRKEGPSLKQKCDQMNRKLDAGRRH